MLTIDESRGHVTLARPDGSEAVWPMDSPEAFSAVSKAWLRCGWDVKYVYGFTWMGRMIKKQADDGSWEDRSVGYTYATSMSLIILQMPKRYLPIFQK